MTGFRCAMIVALGLGALTLTGAARAQENLDAGKTGAQLFASDCQMCHNRPEGLAKAGGLLGLAHFLAEHYTASEESAAKIADYLKAVNQGVRAEPARGADTRRRPAAKPDKSEHPQRSSNRKSADGLTALHSAVAARAG